MDCSICFEKFDSEDHRPKVLQCGHSFCLSCLDQLPVKKCPVDRQEFGEPDDLSDNFVVLQLAEQPPTARRMWCTRCRREATERCLDEHEVRNLRRVQADEARPKLDALQASEEAVVGLQGLLGDQAVSDVNRELRDRRRELAVVEAELAAAQRTLEEAQSAERAAFAKAMTAAEKIHKAHGPLGGGAARMLQALDQPAARCTVILEGEGSSGTGHWAGSVRPREDAAARLLLARMLSAGTLRHSDAAAEQGAVAGSQSEQPPQQRDTRNGRQGPSSLRSTSTLQRRVNSMSVRSKPTVVKKQQQ